MENLRGEKTLPSSPLPDGRGSVGNAEKVLPSPDCQGGVILTPSLRQPLAANPPLVRGRDSHIFAIFCDGTASHLNTLPLQTLCDVFVGKRMGRVLLFNHFLDAPLQDQQRQNASAGPLHRL